MKKAETSIVIDAPAEKVWQVLTDFGHFKEWNPIIRSLKGKTEEGAQLEAHLALNESDKIMKFRPVVLKSERNREFRWLGKLGFKGLFDGEHYFILKPLSDGKTHFIHGEQFSGLLVRFLSNMLRELPAGFMRMNEALKNRVENGGI
ncbi:MAG: SRPBCC domain-containing protein [Owenweeksia sp.]